MTLINRLSAHYLLQGLGQGILLCVLTLFMIEKGLALWEVGVAFGVFSITAVLMELPLGATADLMGRIKVFRWALLVYLAALVMGAFASGFFSILIAMVLMGVSRALESGSVSAWEIEQFRHAGQEDKTPQFLGRLQAFNALGIACGAFIGGYLPNLLINIMPTLEPSAKNLLVIAVLVLVHLTLLPWFFKEGDLKTEHETRVTIATQIDVAIKHGFNQPVLKSVLAIGFIFGMVLSTLEAYWQPFVNDLQPTINYSVFGWLATGYFFSAAIGPALYSALLSKFNVSSQHAITVILIAVAPLLYYLASTQSIWHFAGLYFGFIAVLACINIPVQVLTNKFTSDDIRSTMQSVMSLVIQAGGALAAFGFAPIIQWLGIGSVWRTLALLLLIVGSTRLLKAFLPVLSRRFFSPLFKRSIKRT